MELTKQKNDEDPQLDCLLCIVRVGIYQRFLRTFYVSFIKIYKSECNTTSDWLNRNVSQSDVVLHSNVCIGRKIWRTRLRTF